MGLLANAVAIANRVTNSLGLQATILYEKYQSVDGAGKRMYLAAVGVPAIVTLKQRQVRGTGGQLVMSRATIAILDPTIIVSTFDKITLPDGSTGPILDLEGFVDASTGHPILSEVLLG